ncbi:hypothetical protein [Methanoregula sp.]|uniref:hypothetical protein n=1 Tax=Methanoregula sp. TaxID=2052170 RepID=UPI003568BBAE
MTRGRLPVKAQEVADSIAMKRGRIQHYQYEPGAVFSFTILQKICNVQVRIKCVRRLSYTEQELEREIGAVLADIRLTASGPGITRELWLCSSRYALRFFRVSDDGLVELDRDGVAFGTGA